MDTASQSREDRGRALEGDDGASKVGWRGGVGRRKGSSRRGQKTWVLVLMLLSRIHVTLSKPAHSEELFLHL